MAVVVLLVFMTRVRTSHGVKYDSVSATSQGGKHVFGKVFVNRVYPAYNRPPWRHDRMTGGDPATRLA